MTLLYAISSAPAFRLRWWRFRYHISQGKFPKKIIMDVALSSIGSPILKPIQGTCGIVSRRCDVSCDAAKLCDNSWIDLAVQKAWSDQIWYGTIITDTSRDRESSLFVTALNSTERDKCTNLRQAVELLSSCLPVWWCILPRPRGPLRVGSVCGYLHPLRWCTFHWKWLASPPWTRWPRHWACWPCRSR